MSSGSQGQKTDDSCSVCFHFNTSMQHLGRQGMVKLHSVLIPFEKEEIVVLKDFLQSGLS